MNSWQLVILQTGRTMARMTEIGFPRKFGTGPKGLGSKPSASSARSKVKYSVLQTMGQK